jgi:hypothetical protein
MKLEIHVYKNSFEPKMFEVMMKCHPNRISVMTCSVNFGLAQRSFIECEGIFL